ncbi:MAG: hypothetical protein HQL36_06455 [Alphaproteobacteria bacterium]|nr:hypothetical protein [Alphaproteobacteria bacterium]MBF0251119.1 hypothetical protein [Alphaproteobacteria bacterium]
MSDDQVKRGVERRGERRGVPRPDSPERRKTQYVVTFSTTKKVLPIEDWLEQNCSGSWELRLVGMEDDLQTKIIQVMFQRLGDHDLFVDLFATRVQRVRSLKPSGF